MKRGFALGLVVLFMALAAMVFSLMSCGGGGGSSGSSGSSPIGDSGTGSVAVLLADSPTEEFEHIWLTITEVSLIPVAQNGAPVVIFQSAAGLKVDLLEYRDEDYLLTIKKEVPAGLYAKIRLMVKDIQVEPKQGLTPTCANIQIKLPSGKIDLSPRDSFMLSKGRTLSVRLDIDANKSINLHQAGHSGKCIFRPVVFVDIKEGMPIGRCPKILSGTIEKIIESGGETSGFILGLGDDRGSLEVSLSDNTVIFDLNGDFVGPEDLEVGQAVKVRAKPNNSGVLEASLLIIGKILDILGRVDGPVNTTTYLFPFTPSAGEAITFPIDVKVIQGKTLILIGCDTGVGVEAIQAGMKAQVFGKLVQENGKDVIHAAVVLLRDWVIEGNINAVSDSGGGKTVTIQEQGGASVQVYIPSDTAIYLEGDGTVPMNLLCLGRQVRVFLNPGVSTLLTAALVKVRPEQGEGTVKSIGADPRTLTVDLGGGLTETVYIESGATILESMDDSQGLKLFQDIKVGDFIVYFGLPDCGADKPFHAFVVVITKKEA